jgi:hypothetical protein
MPNERRAEWYRTYRQGVRVLRGGDKERALQLFRALPVSGVADLDGARLAFIGLAHARLAHERRDDAAGKWASEELREAIALSDNPHTRVIARTELAAVLMRAKRDGTQPNASERLEAIAQLKALLREGVSARL